MLHTTKIGSSRNSAIFQIEQAELTHETRNEFLARIDADISPKLSLGISAQPALVQAVTKLNVPFIIRLNLTLKS